MMYRWTVEEEIRIVGVRYSEVVEERDSEVVEERDSEL